MYPQEFLYSRDHEWLRADEVTAVLGITDFAQQELGEVVFVELPEVGDRFDAGDEIGTIESVKAVAEVYIPVAGEIVEINHELEGAPERINEDPHGAGWLVKFKIGEARELDELMSAADYAKFVEGEEG